MIYSRQFFARRDQGGRADQQDDFGFYTSDERSADCDGFLFVLADGMGGQQGGAKASQTAIEAFINAYCSIRGTIQYRLLQALQHANRQIAIDGDEPQYQSMGCTLVAAVFERQQLDWISVGDSILWLWRNGQLRRLNADHSMQPVLNEQVKNAEITLEQAQKSTEKNVLRSVLMGQSIPMIDQNSIEWQTDDLFLAASDGVLTLTNVHIREYLQHSTKKSAQVICAGLLDSIPASEHQDNASLMIVRPSAGKKSHNVLLAVLLVLLVMLTVFRRMW